MKLAENIAIDSRGILIDGRRLPYWLGPGKIEAVVQDPADGGLTEIRLTLIAESVSISPLLKVANDGEVTFIQQPDIEEFK
jgi:hypothetical protein